MATPTPEMIGVYYASKFSDIERSVGTGSTLMNIIATNITDADNLWNGAVGYFCGTSALRGITFHVRTWDKSSNKLTLAQPLPTAPLAGDKFRLFVGGKSATSTEVLCMKISGKQPETESVTGTNIPGITIKKVSPMLGEGTLEMQYASSDKSLRIRVGTNTDYGPEVLLTSDTTSVVLYNRDLAGYVVVNVAYGSLPSGTRYDTYTLSYPKGNMIPNFQGYETNDGVGRTRYHLFVLKNNSADMLDAMTALSLWTGKPEGTASRPYMTYSASYVSPQAMTISDASSWPTRGFWVRNKTANSGAGDLRYVDYRSGNTLYTKPILWGRVTFQNGTTEIKPGMTVKGSSSGSSAVVDQVVLTGGSWSGGDATGTLYLKKFVGTIGSGENIKVDDVVCARPSNTSVRGYRDCTAATWTNSHTVEPASDIDIALELPVGGQYADPTNENITPDGVTFGYHDSRESPLILEALLGGDSVGVWTRETILDGTQARENVNADLNLEWF